MASRKYCSVPCCGEKLGSMFKFPKDPILRERWKSSCKVMRNVSNYLHVCYRHFRATDVDISSNYTRLKTGAVPMLNLPDCIRRKGRRNCIIHACQKDESQGVSLHFFPKSAELRQKWVSACKVRKKVSRNTRNCSGHISDDDFIWGVHGRRLLNAEVKSDNISQPVRVVTSLSTHHKSKHWSGSSHCYGS